MKNIAIILAAGTGSRLGHEQAKQFLKIAVRPLISAKIISQCIDKLKVFSCLIIKKILIALLFILLEKITTQSRSTTFTLIYFL